MPDRDDPLDELAPRRRFRAAARGTGRDFGFLDAEPVSLKIWLPESVEGLLDDWSLRLGTSKSGLVSQLLFTHLYGWCDLHAQYGAEAAWVTQRPRAAASRSPSYRPDLGKNVADVRMFVPPRVRNDLSDLATAAGLKLSAYARRIILDQFIGRMPVPMELPEPPFDEAS